MKASCHPFMIHKELILYPVPLINLFQIILLELTGSSIFSCFQNYTKV